MNAAIKRNAALRSRRGVERPVQARWGTKRGITDTATPATKRRLREAYQRAARQDRRRELRATLVGLVIAIVIGIWVYTALTGSP